MYLGGDHETSASVVRFGVAVRAGSKQGLERSQVTFASGVHESRNAVSVGQIWAFIGQIRRCNELESSMEKELTEGRALRAKHCHDIAVAFHGGHHQSSAF